MPRKVAWPGHIMHIAAPCLSASPFRQNRRCLPMVVFERILLLMAGVGGWGGGSATSFFGVILLSKSIAGDSFVAYTSLYRHGILRSSFLLPWLAEDLSPGKNLTYLIIVPDDLRP